MPNRVVFEFLAKDKFSAIAKKIHRRNVKMRWSFRKLKRSVDKTGKVMKKLAGSMKFLSLAAGVAVTGSLKAFGNMEKGITNVLTLLDDKQVAKFGGAIEKLSIESLTKFGFSTEETTKALFDNISALGTSEKSFEAFAASQRLAIGGVTGLDVAVDGITSIMNAYKNGTQTAEEVANSFFAAQKAGKTTVQELAFNIGKVAPIANVMGIGFKELMATMAQLTLVGLSTEDATTALKGVMTTLQRPAAEARKEFTRLGIPFGVTALKAKGLAFALTQIAKAAETDADIIAELIPNVRALTGISALGAAEIANIQKIIASTSVDVLSPAVIKQMETFNIAVAILKGNIVAAAIAIGAQLAPGFIWLGEKIRGLIDWFQGLSDTTKKWIAYGLVLVAVVSVIAVGLAVMATVIGAAGAAIAVIFGFIFSIPGLIAAMIVATLAAITIAVVQSWDQIKGIVGAIKNFFGFGDSELDANLSKDITSSSKSTFEGELTIKTPKGTTSNMKTKTSGNSNSTFGTNMVDAS